MNYPRIALIVAMIGIVAVARLVSHPPNFTPIAALALFSGAHFGDRKLAFGMSFLALLVTDAMIGFHSTMPFTYLGFVIAVIIGRWLRVHRTVARVAGAAGLSSVVFFGLTNFGVWLVEDLYPKDTAGLMACYVAAIPFFQNSLLGDLTYTGLLFGGMALVEQFIPLLRERPAM